ncbi:hypothetical protein COCVIDRAFT_88408 [Bipolaris victoriae FI3]|uniref:Uncharacterized protein n=2 Tax=Bipolaris TaxID=33194 RepID=W6YJT2_COCC2|nr:uncharacterized protein COCCADRAFT_89714 [Bipolaris zeicola 26-R-13]XP_014560847.1 hypothetical protein COCVIDRAFT_88408 [Bipolaris victoriae FI3]EUC35829.1 hypothetical protein COCCADRAFT_89714 [Bipolaris zeicola 26-R-13]
MSGVLKSFSRSAPIASRALQQRGQALPPIISRTYASGAVPGQSSNVSNPQASSAESQSINHSASIGQTDKNDGDHVSIQNPVSHPENDRVGASEEGTESQDHMKHDPNESDAKKREKTLEYGQNKPLDAADK